MTSCPSDGWKQASRAYITHSWLTESSNAYVKQPRISAASKVDNRGLAIEDLSLAMHRSEHQQQQQWSNSGAFCTANSRTSSNHKDVNHTKWLELGFRLCATLQCRKIYPKVISVVISPASARAFSVLSSISMPYPPVRCADSIRSTCGVLGPAPAAKVIQSPSG